MASPHPPSVPSTSASFVASLLKSWLSGINGDLIVNFLRRRRRSPLINPVCVFKVHLCPPEENRDLIPLSLFFPPIRHSNLKPHSRQNQRKLNPRYVYAQLGLVPFICSNLKVSCNIHQRAMALSCGPQEPHNPPAFCSQSDYFLYFTSLPPSLPPSSSYSPCAAFLANDAFNLQGHCLSFKRAC